MLVRMVSDKYVGPGVLHLARAAKALHTSASRARPATSWPRTAAESPGVSVAVDDATHGRLLTAAEVAEAPRGS